MQAYVADGVALAAGGQLVLADGEAVIDADDTVLSGSTDVRDRVTVITTSYGEFQLLPGGLLLTPFGELLDLRAVRGDVVGRHAAPGTTTADDPADRHDRARRLTVHRHPFDPVAAALGILAIVAGLLVALGEAVDLDTDGPWWLAGAAVLVGLAIIPWRRPRRPPDGDPGERACRRRRDACQTPRRRGTPVPSSASIA